MIHSLHYPVSSNTYSLNLENALTDYGVKVIRVQSRKQFFNEVLFGEVKILHFHWPVEITSPRNRLFATLSCLAFISAIIIFKFRGGRLFWTLHNVKPHQIRFPWLETMVHVFLLKASKIIFVHAAGAIQEIVKEYGIDIRRKSVITLHGNYPEFLDISQLNKCDQPQPKPLKVVCVGNIRTYKGFKNMARAVQGFTRSEIELKIFGKAASEREFKEVYEAASGSDNIEICDRYLTLGELKSILTWCDLVALPYIAIHTSGVAVMALSAARPVIAPRIGLLPDYLDEKCAFLVDSANVNSLKEALLRAIQKRSELPKMSDHARKRSLELDWGSIAETISQTYRN